MTNYSNTTEDTLITFHIGRGGHFYNAGHKKYVDQDRSINFYTNDLFVDFENREKLVRQAGDRYNLVELLNEAISDNKAFERLVKWGFELGKMIYVDNCGPVGLDVDNDSTGVIDIDGQYDTTIVKRLKDCSESELKLINESSNYVSSDVKAYCEELINFYEYGITN